MKILCVRMNLFFEHSDENIERMFFSFFFFYFSFVFLRNWDELKKHFSLYLCLEIYVYIYRCIMRKIVSLSCLFAEVRRKLFITVYSTRLPGSVRETFVKVIAPRVQRKNIRTLNEAFTASRWTRRCYHKNNAMKLRRFDLYIKR